MPYGERGGIEQRDAGLALKLRHERGGEEVGAPGDDRIGPRRRDVRAASHGSRPPSWTQRRDCRTGRRGVGHALQSLAAERRQHFGLVGRRIGRHQRDPLCADAGKRVDQGERRRGGAAAGLARRCGRTARGRARSRCCRPCCRSTTITSGLRMGQQPRRAEHAVPVVARRETGRSSPCTSVREKCAETSGKSRRMPRVTRSTTVLPDGVIVPTTDARRELARDDSNRGGRSMRQIARACAGTR